MKPRFTFSDVKFEIRALVSSDWSQRTWCWVAVSIVFAAGAWYLAGAVKCQGLGFPLDDAWIHQTYARNLAQTGQLAYAPGQVSVGSTSLLWTLLLATGYLLGVVPHLWAYVLGAAGWLLFGWTGARLTERLFPRQRAMAPIVGLACLLEWHLAWAAFSGMEITLFTLLSLLLMERCAAGVRPFWLGLIGGLLVLVRPEGIVLVGLVGLLVLFDGGVIRRRPAAWYGRLATLLDMVAGLAIFLVPYVALNEIVGGRLLPSTFYAKGAEYRTLLAQPIWSRLWIVLRQPLVGAQVLLIPGFVWQAIRVLSQGVVLSGGPPAQNADDDPVDKVSVQGNAAQGRTESPSLLLALLPLAWWGIYHIIYALRLPVDYQHGRYLMPVIPVFLMYGIAGTAHWIPLRPVVRAFKRALVLAIGCLFIAFLVLGGRAYARDLCIINGEMVDVALWLRDNTLPDALVAAHDIGAIGYLAERPLLDLAGLVTPEVIPMIRDEAQLLDFVIQEGADYVATFPSWYPMMVSDDRLVLVYQTDCPLTRQSGGDNMAVYQVRR